VDSVLNYRVDFFYFLLHPFLFSSYLSSFYFYARPAIFLGGRVFFVHLDLHFVHLVVLFLALFIALSVFVSSSLSVNNLE
jgi:hypothetical protein